MEHNGANIRRTENGLRYIEVDVYFISDTVKKSMLTIKISNPTEHELRTCTQIDITSDIPWSPEDIQQNIYYYTITMK